MVPAEASADAPRAAAAAVLASAARADVAAAAPVTPADVCAAEVPADAPEVAAAGADVTIEAPVTPGDVVAAEVPTGAPQAAAATGLGAATGADVAVGEDAAAAAEEIAAAAAYALDLRTTRGASSLSSSSSSTGTTSGDAFWKAKMKAYIMAQSYATWEKIAKPYELLSDDAITPTNLVHVENNYKSRNYIIQGLQRSDFDHVTHLASAHELEQYPEEELALLTSRFTRALQNVRSKKRGGNNASSNKSATSCDDYDSDNNNESMIPDDDSCKSCDSIYSELTALRSIHDDTLAKLRVA
ncbi:uncharacterized protein LOC106866043 [Brachypodium distachyon]|uniref:uncharacterized protein LOC106866043 n=1 Tax=Brachypodium distachyon TaxID=15368 RepID=UPI00071DA04D|nr:uncharacterized protein LOC106866043 [Brachypodium distachyon]|eukprot:XP_014754055.1 uncharacterized protein LOC106866043 [Brachypodium distachyon]